MQRWKVPTTHAVESPAIRIPALVRGTLPQARVETKLVAPAVFEADLAHLFEEALQGW